jgi:hypothetical protein
MQAHREGKLFLKIFFCQTSSWFDSGLLPVRSFFTRAAACVRFWGAPDKPPFWAVLRDAGVDLINTDDLSGLEKFLRTGTLPSP